MKATATAHPIQGLIKYHGLADFRTREPLHSSISACVAPLVTRTTVETRHDEDEVRIDELPAHGRALERAQSVLDAVRERAEATGGVKVESVSSFPQGVGLGSSSSGFAALAMAAQSAYGLDLRLEEVSDLAQRGAGSATRAAQGGIAEWHLTDEGSTSRQLAGPSSLDWPIVMALVDHQEVTEDVHRDVMASPLLDARRDYVEDALTAMREAVREEDRGRIFALAERDTLNLHAVTMTGDRGRTPWRPATLAVMHAVWEMRDEGTPAWFSIDTGATVYVNTLPGHQDEVAERLAPLPGVVDTLRGHVGGQARLVKDHLF